jgi:hypothetical protein
MSFGEKYKNGEEKKRICKRIRKREARKRETGRKRVKEIQNREKRQKERDRNI